MKYAVLTVLVLLFSAVQTTVLKSAEIMGVVPNLLLVAVICYSLILGNLNSIIFGAVIGLLLDLLSGHMVGVNLILCSLTAYMCAGFNGNLFSNNSFVAAVFVLWITFLYEFVIYILYFLFWSEGHMWFAVTHRILPAALYCAVSAFLIYPVMRGVSRLEKSEDD